MSEADTAGGILRVTQDKTTAKLRIVIDGELKTLLEEITESDLQNPARPHEHWLCG